MYLTAADLQQKLSISSCAYVIKKSPPSFEARLQEILIYLTSSDKNDFENLIRSNEFKNKMLSNLDMINGAYDAFLKEGYDKKTACGLLVGTISQVISKGEQPWKNVSKSK